MDNKKNKLKEALKNRAHLVPAKHIIKDINEGIVSLSELLKEDLIPHRIFGEFTDDFLLSRINHESEFFSLEDLLCKNFINQDKLDRLNDYQHKKAEEIRLKKETEDRFKQEQERQEHLNNIRQDAYSNEKIKRLIERNVLTEHLLISSGILTKNQLNEIMERPMDKIKIDFGDWSDVPDLLKDRLDVFVLGISTSGKSAFMAGLLYYVKKIGMIDTADCTPSSFKYYSRLTKAVKEGLLPPRTPVEYIQHLACTFDYKTERMKNPRSHPFTFVEMSGEVFQDCFGETKESMPEKFTNYLFSTNRKIFFLAIDYNQHYSANLEYDQQDQFVYILQFLRKEGALDHADCICILLTKWDKAANQSPENAAKFLNDNYLSLINTCKKYEKELPHLVFKVFPYSLGEFGTREDYTYNPNYSEKVYQFLCKSASYEKEEKKKGWNLFKS